MRETNDSWGSWRWPSPGSSADCDCANLPAADGACSLPGQMAWYGARASGMLAYLLATASVLFGMAITTRDGRQVSSARPTSPTRTGHSRCSACSPSARTRCSSRWTSTPGSARPTSSCRSLTWYRTVWTGLGIIAAYLAIAVYVSFYLRSRDRLQGLAHVPLRGVRACSSSAPFTACLPGATPEPPGRWLSTEAAQRQSRAMFAYRMSTRKAATPVRNRPAIQSEAA